MRGAQAQELYTTVEKAEANAEAKAAKQANE